MLRHGTVLLRCGDVRSPEDLAAVSNSLNCEAYGYPRPTSSSLQAASGGGAAPIISSAEVAAFVARSCSDVRHVRMMPEVSVNESALGWSWEETFNATTKEGGRGRDAQARHHHPVVS